MDLIAEILDAGAKPLYDMRGNKQTPEQFWTDFDLVPQNGIALFNVQAVANSQFKVEVRAGNERPTLRSVLNKCRRADITPALQCCSISERTPPNDPFLRNVRNITLGSKIDRYMLVTNRPECISLINDTWQDLRSPDVGVAFISNVDFVQEALSVPHFDAADYDVNALALRLPDDIEERQSTWGDTLNTLDLVKTRLHDPFPLVLVKASGWPDVRPR